AGPGALSDDRVLRVAGEIGVTVRPVGERLTWLQRADVATRDEDAGREAVEVDLQRRDAEAVGVLHDERRVPARRTAERLRDVRQVHRRVRLLRTRAGRGAGRERPVEARVVRVDLDVVRLEARVALFVVVDDPEGRTGHEAVDLVVAVGVGRGGAEGR